jgi:nucleoside-diphosphate-sugar epimerase
MTSPVALITGATGFVGSHLTRRLAAEGWQTHIIVRPRSSQELLTSVRDQLRMHVHDGSTESMLQILAAARPDVVFHLASLFLASHTAADVRPLIESNVLFATQLVEAMTAHNVHALVNTGTAWQHYENAEYNPVCLYAATKQTFEAILRFYIETTQLKTITLTLFDTYGPRDPRPKLFSVLQRVARTQERLAMSPGEQLLDVVYIDDVVRAFLLAADRVQRGNTPQTETFAVSSGHPVSLRELVRTFEEVSGASLPIEWGKRPYRPREVMTPWTNGAPLPGWTPQIELREGIEMLLRSHG